ITQRSGWSSRPVSAPFGSAGWPASTGAQRPFRCGRWPSGRGAGQQMVVEGFGGGAPAEGLTWPGVERERDGGELVRAVAGGVGAAGEVLAQQPVGVFVCAALPGALGGAEGDLEAGLAPRVGVLGHLRA